MSFVSVLNIKKDLVSVTFKSNQFLRHQADSPVTPLAELLKLRKCYARTVVIKNQLLGQEICFHITEKLPILMMDCIHQNKHTEVLGSHAASVFRVHHIQHHTVQEQSALCSHCCDKSQFHFMLLFLLTVP